MSHIRYTVWRSGRYYYNRRVPLHAVGIYGTHIRYALSSCVDEAAEYAERLSAVLDASWRNTKRMQPVDVAAVIDSFKPRSVLLSDMAEEYLSLRPIRQTPPRVALRTFLW